VVENGGNVARKVVLNTFIHETGGEAKCL